MNSPFLYVSASPKSFLLDRPRQRHASTHLQPSASERADLAMAHHPTASAQAVARCQNKKAHIMAHANLLRTQRPSRRKPKPAPRRRSPSPSISHSVVTRSPDRSNSLPLPLALRSLDPSTCALTGQVNSAVRACSALCRCLPARPGAQRDDITGAVATGTGSGRNAGLMRAQVGSRACECGANAWLTLRAGICLGTGCWVLGGGGSDVGL
jgi:hypothetical protein